MRARWLKPEFFTDKKVAALGPIAALVFQALWCMADDGGTAPCDADTVKAQMFYRWSAVGVPEITGALHALAGAGRIVRYVVGDDTYCTIPTWETHQQVHKPSKFRNPHISQGVAVGVPEQCGTSEAPLPASPPPRHLDSQTPRPLDTHTPRKAAGVDEHFERAWAKYPKRIGGNSRADALRMWKARLAQGVDPAELEAATYRYAAFCDATAKTGTEKVKQGATFYGPGEHWKETWESAAIMLTGNGSPGSRGRVLLELFRTYDLLAYGGEAGDYEAKIVKATTDPLAGPSFRAELKRVQPWKGIDAPSDFLKAREIDARLSSKSMAGAA